MSSNDNLDPKKVDDEDDEGDEEEEEEEEEEEGNIAEILMAQANKDMDEKKQKELFDAQIKKKIILKKKSDKEYEAYWSKKKGESGVNCYHIQSFAF